MRIVRCIATLFGNNQWWVSLAAPPQCYVVVLNVILSIHGLIPGSAGIGTLSVHRLTALV